jgi:uncharacterized membrane protein YfcA
MPSMLLIGMPIHQAIAAAKFANIFSSFSSFIVLLKDKTISFKSVIKIMPVALLGGTTGGIIANLISEQIMTMIAVILLTFALLLTLIKKPKEVNQENTNLPKSVYPILFGIGVYDGMFGPGQATLLMYTYLHKGFSYLKALAYSRFQTFISCFGSIFSYVAAGNFNIEASLFYVIGSVLGAQVAVRIVHRISAVHLKRLLNVITVILIVQLSLRVII